MLAALFVASLPGPTLTEIAAPQGWEAFASMAVSPRGELVYQAYHEDEDFPAVFLWKNGKNTRYKFVDEAGYHMDVMGSHDASVLGFSSAGSFYGYQVFAYNGASSTWMNRPFIAKNGEIRPLPLPKELWPWNDLNPVAQRPDGAFLLEGIEATMNSMMGDPKTWIDRLMWVKDGKLIAEVGKATNPFLDEQGRIVAATQFDDEDGDLTGGSIYHRRAFVVLMRNGKFERVGEGEVVARFDNGDLLIKRSVFSRKDQPYDEPDKATYHRLQGTKVSDYEVPGLPPHVSEFFIGSDGRGMVHGWDRDTEILRSFTRTGFHNVPIPVRGVQLTLHCYASGWFALSHFDEENGDSRLFLGRV